VFCLTDADTDTGEHTRRFAPDCEGVMAQFEDFHNYFVDIAETMLVFSTDNCPLKGCAVVLNEDGSINRLHIWEYSADSKFFGHRCETDPEEKIFLYKLIRYDNITFNGGFVLEKHLPHPTWDYSKYKPPIEKWHFKQGDLDMRKPAELL
jgi:hypothetical protein